jgi:hypothetical protein
MNSDNDPKSLDAIIKSDAIIKLLVFLVACLLWRLVADNS